MARPAPVVFEALAVPELAAFMASSPLFACAPRGEGRHVLVIPGFTAGDVTTVPMRTMLRFLGHRPHGWGLGANLGPDNTTVRALMRHMDRLVHDNGGPIDIVGWSLGGIFGRLIALYRPEDVRQVVSMGSPLRVSDPSANLSQEVRFLADLAGLQGGRRPHDLGQIPVPSTAVYSRLDGVAAAATCRQEAGPFAENVEVLGAHSGLAHHPAVVYLVADRLAQGDGRWQPFDPPRALRPLYPTIEGPASEPRSA